MIIKLYRNFNFICLFAAICSDLKVVCNYFSRCLTVNLFATVNLWTNISLRMVTPYSIHVCVNVMFLVRWDCVSIFGSRTTVQFFFYCCHLSGTSSCLWWSSFFLELCMSLLCVWEWLCVSYLIATLCLFAFYTSWLLTSWTAHFMIMTMHFMTAYGMPIHILRVVARNVIIMLVLYGMTALVLMHECGLRK